MGLLNLREILEAGVDQTNLFKLEAVVFGSDDFFANIGGFHVGLLRFLWFSDFQGMPVPGEFKGYLLFNGFWIFW